LPLCWELFDAESSKDEAAAIHASIIDNDILLEEDALSSTVPYNAVIDDLGEQFKIKARLEMYAFLKKNPKLARPLPRKELRRLVYAARWEREDPVTQLPPDVSYEKAHILTTGLSVEHTQKLAQSLGVSVGNDAAGLRSRLDQEFGLKVNVTAQQQLSKKITLTNPRSDHYRLYAFWHVSRRFTVDALDIRTATTTMGSPR